jgi:hypothetical protein
MELQVLLPEDTLPVEVVELEVEQQVLVAAVLAA